MPRVKPIVLLAVLFLCCISFQAYLQPSASGATKMQILEGTFSVTLLPQQDGDFDTGRMTIDKEYQGPLSGTGKGQMLSHRTNIEGSAGYVAVEKFVGDLSGKKGSFVLIHRGLMDKGQQNMSIQIIADSGTEALSGISGNMEIEIVDGQHRYKLTYQFE